MKREQALNKASRKLGYYDWHTLKREYEHSSVYTADFYKAINAALDIMWDAAIENGIREGFSAAREVMSGYDKDSNGTNFHQDEIDERSEAFQMVSKYPSINHYLNSKQ